MKRFLAALLALSLLAAACGSDSAGSDSESETDGVAETADAGAFPVTLDHAFGATEVDAEPQRVVTWGWGSTEAALAAGVYPVAISRQDWTVGEGNLLPWVQDAYDAAGVEHPVLLTDDFVAVPYEEIIAVDPDLIIATYSGIDEEQWSLMNDIAPTLAYPESAWTTAWDENIRLVTTILGQAAAGEQVLTDNEAYLAEQAAAHPEFEGVTVAALFDGDGFVSVYTGLDPRVAILTELGFELAPSLETLDDSSGGFYFELSYEELDKLEADVLISYHDDQAQADAFLAKPEVQAIPAVAAGNTAQVIGREYISAVSPPTALSVQWGMPNLIEILSTTLAS